MIKKTDAYRIAFEQSDAGLALVSLAGARFVDANQRFCGFSGRNRDELVGSHWPLIAGIDDLDLIKSKIEDFAGQLGGLHCCDISVKASVDCDTSPSFVLIEVRDITEQRASELKAIRRVEELEAVVDAVPAAIWLAHDPNCERISANHISREWIQMPREESFFGSGTRVQDITWSVMADNSSKPLDISELPIMRAACGEKVDNFEGKLIFTDGRQVDVFGNARPLLDANGKPRGAVSAFVDITDRKRAEAREHLLAREVDHRARNILTVVQAIIQLTKSKSVDDFRHGLAGRIGSLARVHTLISDNSWRSVDLWRLVAAELAPFGFDAAAGMDNHSLKISGPDVALNPAAAQAFSLTLHELSTNSAKYGALASPNGKIRIDWDWIEEGAGAFCLCWQEYDGQPTTQPDLKGFGMTLIQTSIEDQLQGKISYRWLADGLKVHISCPVNAVTDSPPPDI